MCPFPPPKKNQIIQKDLRWKVEVSFSSYLQPTLWSNYWKIQETVGEGAHLDLPERTIKDILGLSFHVSTFLVMPIRCAFGEDEAEIIQYLSVDSKCLERIWALPYAHDNSL